MPPRRLRNSPSTRHSIAVRSFAVAHVEPNMRSIVTPQRGQIPFAVSTRPSSRNTSQTPPSCHGPRKGAPARPCGATTAAGSTSGPPRSDAAISFNNRSVRNSSGKPFARDDAIAPEVVVAHEHIDEPRVIDLRAVWAIERARALSLPGQPAFTKCKVEAGSSWRESRSPRRDRRCRIRGAEPEGERVADAEDRLARGAGADDRDLFPAPVPAQVGADLHHEFVRDQPSEQTERRVQAFAACVAAHHRDVLRGLVPSTPFVAIACRGIAPIPKGPAPEGTGPTLRHEAPAMPSSATLVDVRRAVAPALVTLAFALPCPGQDGTASATPTPIVVTQSIPAPRAEVWNASRAPA